MEEPLASCTFCHCKLNFKEVQKSVSTDNNVSNEDYKSIIPIRKAMFCHLNKTIIIQLLKGVLECPNGCYRNNRVLKDPLTLSFLKVTLKPTR